MASPHPCRPYSAAALPALAAAVVADLKRAISEDFGIEVGAAAEGSGNVGRLGVAGASTAGWATGAAGQVREAKVFARPDARDCALEAARTDDAQHEYVAAMHTQVPVRAHA